MATITVFEAGYCTHMACMALRGAGTATCRFPARAYLIETARNRWLWDTGYASHFIDSTRSGLFAWYRRLTPVHFDPATAVAQQLRQRGIREEDLTAVILSHFHGDHIAGLRDFRRVPTWLSGQGWATTRSLRGFGALRKGFVPALIPSDFEASVTAIETFEEVELPAELEPFTRAYAAPGSGGELLLVELPGHAAGHLGAFVETGDGWVLLASDAAWSPTSYREQIGPSRLAHLIMDDAGRYYDTLHKLHLLHKKGGVRICLTHEGAL
ncbi:MBL fold metallo-hydrolase [Trinickia caryophylli]|uniref:Metallo-beta-lactamase superfamily protein n=1 Tax=Trinickia caryophylli TaxID=28094 RepID=A0A1X7EHI0_TRICW|nr:MBL fold metallo-hydrolase [Trinickia caryophylli]PMS11026.1 MBL fold metallo-hydrolase [Trinickia caryophylli]TRX14483.1 MBL fold metallo-hydrolase [Trinickia caryophylli]WQE14322.1 MBL fold metallo-hydrolase [Trinickia caryophylli]SMF33963.1 Metallo-beta-lactamase superfamily protein [Trinickia caryophylli]GLU32295.1 MBL fold hydrolase [Trinickia caryophylli]